MSLDREKAITVLNRILGLALAGVVRYTHYALMVYCYRFIIVPKVAVDTATLSTAPQSPRSGDPRCFSARPMRIFPASPERLANAGGSPMPRRRITRVEVGAACRSGLCVSCVSASLLLAAGVAGGRPRQMRSQR